jgi:hypothetical protein
MTYIQRCMVVHCDCPAEQVWCTRAGYQGWSVEWCVCADHFDQLFRGEKAAPVYETTRNGHRWLVMGDDLSISLIDGEPWARGQNPKRHRMPLHMRMRH